MIVANLITQFGNNLGSISAGRILSEKFNTEFAICLPYDDKIFVSEFDMYIDWKGQTGYDRLYNKYKRVDAESIKDYEELVIENIDTVVIDPSKNYVINKFLFYRQLERHIDFVRKEFDFILNNPNDDHEYLNSFKNKTVFYYRTNFSIYLMKYDQFTKKTLKRKISINTPYCFVTDNKMTLQRYFKSNKLSNDIDDKDIIKHNDFLTDFLILTKCKKIYSIGSSSFSSMAALLGGVPIYYVNSSDKIHPEKIASFMHTL